MDNETNSLKDIDTSIFTPKEWKILSLVLQGKDNTEIGKEFKVTRERIRQIKAKMERKVNYILANNLKEK